MAELTVSALGSLELFLALLVVAISLLTVGLVWIAMRVLILERCLRQNAESKDNEFEALASELLEQGKLQELVQHAEARVETHPYHVDARWYLAVGYYHLGEMGKAVREFERVAAINPAWEETGVAPFIDRISAVRDQAFSVAHH